MQTISFYTLGCRANQYETDVLTKQAIEHGLNIVPYPGPADIYVINTCTVTGNAGRKSRHAIRHAKKINPNAKVIATGCDIEIEQIPEADFIIKNSEKFTISTLFPNKSNHRDKLCSSKIRANLMIENGCENFCSYCIVPYVRGPVRSRPMDEVLIEAKGLVKDGVKEIILTGINIGEWRTSPPTPLHFHENGEGSKSPVKVDHDPTNSGERLYGLNELLSDLSTINELERIRLSSIEPMYITDELIKTIKTNPKVCKHLHIPLQSGDDMVLKTMNRTYTSKEFEKLIKKIKKEIKDVAVTTDIIVGFPGETDKAFNATCELAEKLKFPRIHIFPYSDRPGTAAAKMKNKIDPKVIDKRYKKLDKLRLKYMELFNDKYAGKNIEVLIEQKNKKTGLFEGLTGNYIRIGIKGPAIVGDLIKIKLKSSDIILT